MPQQAYSTSYRSPSRGGYQVPPQGGSSLYYRNGSKTGARIDGSVRSARMLGGPDEGPIAQRGNQFTPNRPTRADNIAKARADGTFDMKRAAYNSANKDSFMDERGTIGPKAPLPTGNPSNERVPVPAASPTASPAAKPEMMGPRKPATFEGKSRAEWFGAAAQRQKQGNAYSNQAVAQAKPAQAAPSASTAFKPAPLPGPAPAGTKEPPRPFSSPAPIVDAVGPGPNAKPASTTAFKPAPLPGPAPAGTKEPPRPFSSPAPIVAPAGSPVAASSVVSSQKATTPASKDSWFSNAEQTAAKGANDMMTDRANKVKRIAELENKATPGTTKIARGVVNTAKAVGTGVKAAAQGLNEGIPAMASAATTGSENIAKAAVKKAKDITAPARTWMQGDQKAAAEAAKLKSELNPTPPKAYVPTYTGGSNPPVPTAAMDGKKKPRQVASKQP